MQLPLQDFTTLVRTASAAVQAAASGLVDLTVGSVLRAVLEANAALALWMQWLILQLLGATRAATSQGTDLDTWVADFGVARLPGSPAGGQVLFSRTTPGQAALIPAGSQVRTADAPGSTDAASFAVVADPTHAAWTGDAYRIAAADTSILLPVAALLPGAASNVQPGAIALLASSLPGIDAVTNPLPLLGGLDAEPDTALRARFANFLDSRVRATSAAIAYAIASVRQGLRFTLAENQDTSGAFRPGTVTITLDDGTGRPGPTLLAAVAAAVETVRPLGSTISIRPPLLLGANIALTLAPTSLRAEAALPVTNAVAAWINALPIGAPLRLSRIISLAYAAHPGITDVAGVTINGLGADLEPPPHGLVRNGTITVS